VYPERNSYDPDNPGWGWMSNNSVAVNVGDDLSRVVDGIRHNGEPGVIWMDVSREYGRLIDPPNNKDWRAEGYKPSAEQTLESYECCRLLRPTLTGMSRWRTTGERLRSLTSTPRRLLFSRPTGSGLMPLCSVTAVLERL